jgi:hypothetical protein
VYIVLLVSFRQQKTFVFLLSASGFSLIGVFFSGHVRFLELV